MSLQAVKEDVNSLSEADITNYWRYYGLKHDPFSTEIDDASYCSFPRWEEYLDLLQFLCHYNNVILAVSGNSCSGKTTLLRQFRKQINDSMRICELKASSGFSTPQLLTLLAEQFHLELDINNALEEQLEQLVTQIQESSKICLLLIDDAHNVAVQALRALVHLVQLQSDNQMKLHIVLFGESHLQVNLNRVCEVEGNSEALIHNLNIGFLSLEETEKYLEHRLFKAGFEENPLVQTVINRIYKLSGGAPGRINRIARRTLLNDLVKQAPEQKASFLHQNQSKLIGGTLLVLILASVAIAMNWMRSNNPQWVKQQKSAAPVLVDNAPAPLPSTAASPVQPAVEIQNPTMPVMVETSTQQGSASANPTVTVTSTNPAITPAQITNPPSAALPPPVNTVTPVTPAKAAIIPTPVSAPPVISQQDAKALQASLAAASKAKPADEPAPASIAAVKEPKANSAAAVDAKLPASTKHLLTVAPSSYGLQLLGLSNVAAVNRFIANNQLAGKANYYRTVRDGKEWYVVIYGEFKSPAEAKAAAAKLSATIKDLKPWVRSYKAIQAVIKAAKK